MASLAPSVRAPGVAEAAPQRLQHSMVAAFAVELSFELSVERPVAAAAAALAAWKVVLNLVR